MVDKNDYLIERILPANDISIIGGPSGVGKTTWTLQFMQALAREKEMFGFRAHPRRFAYVSMDRSLIDVQRVLERVGIPEDDFPFIDSRRDMSIKIIVKKTLKRYPGTRLIIVEAFSSLMEGKINDYNKVRKVLVDTNILCEELGITILGIVHANKTKEGEGYLSARDTLLGSVAWGGFSQTLFIFRRKNPGNSADRRRILDILPRHAPDVVIPMDFSTGLMLQDDNRYGKFDSAFQGFSDNLVPGATFPLAALLDLEGVKGIAHRTTALKWASRQIKLGKLRKHIDGYEKVKPLIAEKDFDIFEQEGPNSSELIQ